MKDFKPMRELINALLDIAKAIKGESSDSGSETKSNKIIGLNGPDKILVWANGPNSELEYQYVDTYQEFKSFYDDPKYSEWEKYSIFVYKNNDLNADDALMYCTYRESPDVIVIKDYTSISKNFVKLSEAEIDFDLDVSKIEDADKWYVIVQDEDEGGGR